MRRSRIVFITVVMILFFALGTNLPLFTNKLSYAQPLQDKTLSQQQRLGTYNILYFPNNVSIVYSNNQNALMDQEFILLGNNPKTPGNYQVALSDADYGLPIESVKSIPILTTGKNFSVDSTTDSDIRYSLATVTLVLITSLFHQSIQRFKISILRTTYYFRNHLILELMWVIQEILPYQAP